MAASSVLLPTGMRVSRLSKVDVARAFGQECLWYIINACVIMHNIIIEDDRVKDEDHTNSKLMGFVCK
jgi:hypothetical protein